MKTIIRNDLINYQPIQIDDSIAILDYLKECGQKRFILQHINQDLFETLCKTKGIIYLEHRELLAGYCYPPKGNDFRTSGNLKLSDSDNKVPGSFIIIDKKIIYDSSPVPFYKERDSSIYFGTTYYTTMKMPELLEEIITPNKRLLIYMGEEIVKCHSNHIFKPLTKEEIMECATNPEIGKEAFQKRKYY